MPSPNPSRPPSPTPSQLPPVPGSPVYSIASTANPLSSFNLPLPPAPRPSHAVLTKQDLESSHLAYADLVASAKSYRLALATLSTAASSFASALESCARLKESRAEPIGHHAAGAAMTASFTTTKGACTADTLLSASGVHHLIANHHQILSETVYRSFEVPLLHDLDKWQTAVDDEEETYQARIKAQSREVKRLEKEGLKLHRQRRRDVARFRAHLVDLTRKLDGLTTLHADHARALLRESQDTSARIVDASCSLVRAEVDIFESLARKGWTGGGLDDLLDKGVDLFAAEGQPADGVGASQRHNGVGAAAAPGAGDADSVFSADFNRPRGARPFSPQPIRRVPADVTFESLGAAVGEPPADAPRDGEHERQPDEQRGEDDDQEAARGRTRSSSDLTGERHRSQQEEEEEEEETAADTWEDS
ncbi:Phospholipid-binding protein, partial [Metarhizium majus ARSEF 297]